MRRVRLASFVVAVGIVLAASAGRGQAGDVSVAVAANFAEALDTIAGAFAEGGSDRVVASVGSTGQLYAKIGNGAPYDVFLAADTERPRLLVEEGLAVAGSRFTYAVGRLALWSTDPALVDGPEVLRRDGWRHLAIASPDLAPYGAAAERTLRALGLWEAVQPRLVRGANIGQTFQFVATGNAELGFVALSQLASPRNETEGSAWRVPPHLHEAIRQDAVLLRRAADKEAARRFLGFLAGEEAGRIIDAFGYGRGE